MWGTIVAGLKSSFIWAWANKQAALLIAALLIIAFLSWKNNRNNIKIQELTGANGKLEERLKNQTIITRNQVIYKDRDKIVIKYVPVEGGVTVNTTKDGKTELKIKNLGFTLKPGVGILYAGRGSVNGALDLKLGYWDRYSLGLGSTLDSPYFWTSRHVDDLTLGVVNNAELTVGYGKPYADFGGSLVLFGLRTNF